MATASEATDEIARNTANLSERIQQIDIKLFYDTYNITANLTDLGN